jgi:aarF domain-containing kinase
METDYLKEAEFLTRYQKNFSQDQRFHIPQVFPEFSTDKVLCLEFCSGTPLREWLEKPHDEKTLQTVSIYALELFLKEFYEFGLVQTDPNFGNFLVRENPLSLVLLDFGSTKEYSQDFLQKYKAIVRSAFLNDEAALLKHTFEFNFLSPKEPAEVQAKYLELMNAIVEPFQTREPFDFNNNEFMQKTKELSWDFSQSLKFSPYPKDLIFLHRKLGGVFGLMKKCQAKMVLRPYMEKALEL